MEELRKRNEHLSIHKVSDIYSTDKKVRHNAFKKDIQNKRNKDILLIHIFAYGIL